MGESKLISNLSTASMDNHLFNLKFASKQLQRDSKRCEKEEKAEKTKLKKAIEKGNMEVARIHAENAIRMTNSMQGVVKAMDSAMKSMNLEKISGLMDKFE